MPQTMKALKQLMLLLWFVVLAPLFAVMAVVAHCSLQFCNYFLDLRIDLEGCRKEFKHYEATKGGE
jgi:flagellar biosynthesis protein FlhB